MNGETPQDDPNFDIDPDVVDLMNDLDQAMESGDWTIEQAEQAVADSEWGRTTDEVNMTALRGPASRSKRTERSRR